MRACSPFADIQVLIAAALAEERGALIPIHRQAIDELLDREHEHEHAKSAMDERARSLELSVAKLEAAVSALELALVTERGKVLFLPNPLKAGEPGKSEACA